MPASARQYQLVLRGLVANFVIVPCVLTFVLQGVPLETDMVIGLLVLAAVPVAPLAPPFVGLGRGDVAYAVGLMLIVAFLGLPLTPRIYRKVYGLYYILKVSNIKNATNCG